MEDSKNRWSGSGISAMVSEDIENGVEDDKHNQICRLRYQQSPVEVTFSLYHRLVVEIYKRMIVI